MAYAIVVAGKGGRRSEVAREVAAALARRGLRVGGFTERSSVSDTGAKSLDLVRVRDGAAVRLAGPAGGPADPAACSLSFDRAAFEVARRWIEEDAPSSDVLVVDGLGKLELGGEGHRDAIARALAVAPLVVLAVRDDQLVYAVEAFGLDEPTASYTDGEGPAAGERFVAEVARAARTRRSA
jgi:nucleoside-triphosphatase THEP1